MSNTLDKALKIYVAGHNGLVGSAIVRALKADGYQNLLLRTREELDLMDQSAVRDFMENEKPDFMFVAAARVGGIYANDTYPAEFIHDNLVIETNLIHSAYASGMQRLIFLGSSCIYPRDCPQPMREEYLLTGPLEKTNEPYAIAKIAGIKLCEAYNRQYGTKYICLMPTNLYGPGDNYDLNNSHVLPALIRKFIDAREKKLPNVSVWGTGNPRREFLFVDDLADACVFMMNYQRDNDQNIYNVGWGKDISISELVNLISESVGYKCEINWEVNKPDGTPRKLLDTSKLTYIGWEPKIGLIEGIAKTIKHYLIDHC